MSNYELYHFGVKGMKWGVRKQTKQAKKDAKEYARAKMFYGEGAGTRRKLIKNTVNQRSKDPTYKKAFDEALAKQDMADHAAKARGERKRKDIRNSAAKTGRGLANIVTGHPERVGAGLAVAALAYGAAHRAGLDKIVAKHAKSWVSSVRNSVQAARGRRAVEQLFRNTERMRNR